MCSKLCVQELMSRVACSISGDIFFDSITIPWTDFLCPVSWLSRGSNCSQVWSLPEVLLERNRNCQILPGSEIYSWKKLTLAISSKMEGTRWRTILKCSVKAEDFSYYLSVSRGSICRNTKMKRYLYLHSLSMHCENQRSSIWSLWREKGVML